jgi:hypothetical protein
VVIEAETADAAWAVVTEIEDAVEIATEVEAEIVIAVAIEIEVLEMMPPAMRVLETMAKVPATRSRKRIEAATMTAAMLDSDHDAKQKLQP